MLVLRGKVDIDGRFPMLGRASRAWQHRLEKELVGPSGEEGAYLSGKIKTSRVLIERYSEIEEENQFSQHTGFLVFAVHGNRGVSWDLLENREAPELGPRKIRVPLRSRVQLWPRVLPLLSLTCTNTL